MDDLHECLALSSSQDPNRCGKEREQTEQGRALCEKLRHSLAELEVEDQRARVRESVEDAAELHREHQKRHNIIRARERCNELEQLLRDSALQAAQDAAHAAHHAQHTAQQKRETAMVQEEQALMMERASAYMMESAKVIAESETARIKVEPGREVNSNHDVKASWRWHHLAPDSDNAKVKGACHNLTYFTTCPMSRKPVTI